MLITGPTNEEYWSQRYQTGNIPWDAGEITTPIKEYADQLIDKDLRILIPGAGSGYEAEYFWNKGFKNVAVIDLSVLPLKNLKNRCPEFPDAQLIEGDFFSHQGKYDRIIEQTFFCALHPTQRPAYIEKMHSLLVPGGRLVGVLFDDPLFTEHPPYGGNEQDYRKLFFPRFEEHVFSRCHNSIPPRQGREFFINVERVN